MLELAANLRLFDEPADHPGLIAELFPKHLDGQVAAQVGIKPPEHDPHPSLADLAEELQSLGPVMICRLRNPERRWRGRTDPEFGAAKQYLRHPAERLGQGSQDARCRRAQRDKHVLPIEFTRRHRAGHRAGLQPTDRAKLARFACGPRLAAFTATIRFLHRRDPPKR